VIELSYYHDMHDMILSYHIMQGIPTVGNAPIRWMFHSIQVPCATFNKRHKMPTWRKQYESYGMG